MQLIIAILGLGSFASVFLGTAIGILFFGFDIGLRILVASALVLVMCVIADKIFNLG
jgi:hypothetical protein